jgi:ATP-binding cassette subfamily C protein
MFGAAAYRLMPSMNRLVSSITTIRYHRSAVKVVHGDLQRLETEATLLHHEDAKDAPQKIRLTQSIELRDVSYRYPNITQDALSHVSFVIPKGHSVAFTGPSGAGKTTVVDVMLGLLFPTTGQVLVDGIDVHENLGSWQRQIGYIPQTIYLLDDTVRRNVTFGLADEKIDDARVWAALKDAQLEELIKQMPQGLDTSVGERGARISGGQRQRIGIARALYYDPQVLVFDEATSSLDMEMENEISKAIERLRKTKTLIIIAHRLSTVEKCEIKFTLKSGKIENVVHNLGTVDA